jgi:hypothetical protein
VPVQIQSPLQDGQTGRGRSHAVELGQRGHESQVAAFLAARLQVWFVFFQGKAKKNENHEGMNEEDRGLSLFIKCSVFYFIFIFSFLLTWRGSEDKSAGRGAASGFRHLVDDTAREKKIAEEEEEEEEEGPRSWLSEQWEEIILKS